MRYNSSFFSIPWAMIVACLFGATDIQGQVTVSGVVTGDEQESLIGVNILVKNSTIGTITDFDGTYTLEVPDGNITLVFSYIGYNAQEILLKNRTTLDVVLSQSTQLMNEVVVIGYGTVRKSDLTGSVGTIKSGELKKIANANVLQALQGKVAGVQVSSTSGRPGDSPVVRIRGTGTLNGAAPIYVVDGLILDDISFLNANDIESMEVLKDASSSAIYGTRGANGVILITTRKGERGQRARFNFNTYAGVQQVNNRIALANATEYAQLANEIAQNTGGKAPFENPAAFGEGTNWQDAIFRDAAVQNYNLSITGGSDAMTYAISGDAFLQEGVIRTSDYKRYSLRVNNEYNLVKGLKFGHNLVFVSSNNNHEPGGIVFNAYAADPTAPVRDSTGQYGNTSRNSNVSNPAAQLEYNSYNRGYSQQFSGNTFAELYTLKNITIRSSLGFNLINSRSKGFEPEFEVNDKQRNPESNISVGYTRFTDWQWENTVNYQKDWGKHRLNALAGYIAQERSGETYGGSRKRLIGESEEFFYLNSGDVETQTNYNIGFTPERYISYLFRANYAYLNRYLLTASFRRDGSSKFGSTSRYGNFPSVALAWRLIEEPFMAEQSLFTNFKVRASWGRLGNDKIPTGAAVPTVTNNLSAIFGPTEQLIFGASLISLANPQLQWEETNSIDVGLEMGFIQNRLTLELDYYRRQTEKILVPVPIPDYVGSSGNPFVNAADVLNRGVDLAVNYRNAIGQFNYQIGLMGSTVYNEVLALGTGNEEIFATGTRTIVGEPIGSFFGYQVAGIYQNVEEINQYPNREPVKPGDLRFADINGDNIIDTEDRTTLGSPIPDLIYGMNFGFDVAGFDFSIDFNGVRGNKIFNSKRTARGFGIPNFETSFLDRWTSEGTSTTEPRVTNGGYPNYVMSDRFLEDGAFFRLRSIQLGYTLPEALLKQLHLSKLRFYLSGNNVMTWTDYSGYSPEISSENVLQVGIDGGIYPLSRVYTIGLNASF